jgi:hypothetical protein
MPWTRVQTPRHVAWFVLVPWTGDKKFPQGHHLSFLERDSWMFPPMSFLEKVFHQCLVFFSVLQYLSIIYSGFFLFPLSKTPSPLILNFLCRQKILLTIVKHHMPLLWIFWWIRLQRKHTIAQESWHSWFQYSHIRTLVLPLDMSYSAPGFQYSSIVH